MVELAFFHWGFLAFVSSHSSFPAGAARWPRPETHGSDASLLASFQLLQQPSGGFLHERILIRLRDRRDGARFR